MGKVLFLQGNEAIFEGALAAGGSFFAGYPITPSSEIAHAAAKRLPEVGGTYLQMEDELASMAAIVGASLAGAKSFTATSGPGFSLMQENLGLAIMAEVPCVIINIQRSGPSTGLATKPAQADFMQARWGTHGDHAIIALSPSTVQECFDLTIEAFNLSETYRTPVILLADETIGHLRERVVIPDQNEIRVVERPRPQSAPEDYLPYGHLRHPVASKSSNGSPVAPLAAFGSPYVFHANGSMHDETGYPQSSPQKARQVIAHLHDKIEDNADRICRSAYYGTEAPDNLIVSFGTSCRSAREAAALLTKDGLSVGVLQLMTLWPFPESTLLRFAGQVRRVVVPEMNLGQMVREVQRVWPTKDQVVSCARSDGLPIEPSEIADRIRGLS